MEIDGKDVVRLAAAAVIGGVGGYVTIQTEVATLKTEVTNLRAAFVKHVEDNGRDFERLEAEAHEDLEEAKIGLHERINRLDDRKADKVQ